MANYGFMINLPQGSFIQTPFSIGSFHLQAIRTVDVFGNYAEYSIVDKRPIKLNDPRPQLFSCNFICNITGGLGQISALKYYSIQQKKYVSPDPTDQEYMTLLKFFANLLRAELVTYDITNGQTTNIEPYVEIASIDSSVN